MTNLPRARDFTLNPGDPFPSLLGNSLQDQFIGDKHTDRPFFIPPIAFMNSVGVNAAYTGGVAAGGGIWTHTASATMELQAPLIVPPGTSIDKIEAFFKRAASLSAGDQYNIRIISRTLTLAAAPASQVVVATQVLGNAANNFPNLDHVLLAGVPIVTQPNTAYWIQWDTFLAAGSGDIFYGVGGSISRA